MCFTDEDKKRLQDPKTTYYEAHSILLEAMDDCEFTGGPWYDGEWIVDVSCSKCGFGLSGVVGSSEGIIEFLAEDLP